MKKKKYTHALVKSIDKTDRYIGIGSGGMMANMIGRIFPIEAIWDNTNIELNNDKFSFYFHPGDLKLLSDEDFIKEEQIFKFDVEYIER